jgi:hypothetical protein
LNDIQTRFGHPNFASAETDEALVKIRAQNGELEVQLVLARRAQREAEEALQQAMPGPLRAGGNRRAGKTAPISVEATSKLRGRPPA